MKKTKKKEEEEDEDEDEVLTGTTECFLIYRNVYNCIVRRSYALTLVTESPASYGIRVLMTVPTEAHHLSLSVTG